MRQCKTCGEEKPLDEFTHLVKNGRGYHSWRCKLCRADYAYRSDRDRSDRVKNRWFAEMMRRWRVCR